MTGRICANGDVKKLMFFDKLSKRGHKPGSMFNVWTKTSQEIIIQEIWFLSGKNLVANRLLPCHVNLVRFIEENWIQFLLGNIKGRYLRKCFPYSIDLWIKETKRIWKITFCFTRNVFFCIPIIIIICVAEKEQFLSWSPDWKSIQWFVSYTL